MTLDGSGKNILVSVARWKVLLIQISREEINIQVMIENVEISKLLEIQGCFRGTLEITPTRSHDHIIVLQDGIQLVSLDPTSTPTTKLRLRKKWLNY